MGKTNPLARIDLADRAEMTARVLDLASMARTDHFDEIVYCNLRSPEAKYTAWQLIAAAADETRRIIEEYNLDALTVETLTDDVPDMRQAAAEAFLSGVVYRHGRPHRDALDQMIATWGAIHSLDASRLVLRNTCRAVGPTLHEELTSAWLDRYAQMTKKG